MARKLAPVLMAALMGIPPSTTALGLGEIDSDSGLNEPLSARIPLLSIRDADIASIRVSLASPAAFERAGLDRPFYLSRLKFELRQAEDGRRYILVSTEKPFKEPFLDFLLDVRWPQGKLQREYTVLLSPPQYLTAHSAESMRSGLVRASRMRPQNATYAAFGSSPAVSAGERSVVERGESTRYGPVQAKQTLWSIANEVRPSGGVTVYQTMQAILQSNPEAFIDGNINALMEGSVLRVPPREAIARIDAGEAARQMQEQLVRWQEQHSGSDFGTPQAQASTPAMAMKQDGAGVAPATVTPPAKGGLHVVAVPEGAATQIPALATQVLAPTQQNIRRLQQQLAAVEERNATLQSTNAQLQRQASALKEELADVRGLVDSKLGVSARLPITEPALAPNVTSQEAAIDLHGDTPLAGASETPLPSPLKTSASGHGGQTEVKSAAVAETTVLSAPITAVNPAAGSGPARESRGPQPAPAAISLATKAQSKPAEPAAGGNAAQAKPPLKAQLLGYLQHHIERLGLLAASLLLGLLVLAWAVHRRRRGATGLPRESVPELSAATEGQTLAFMKPDKSALDRPNTQPHPATAVNEGTPLDEAEAYIAYGRYDQAQELLDRALGENPDNQELRLKLLEVLVAQGDRGGFEAEAQVLHAQITDKTEPSWQRLIELARHIAPEHPLFRKAMPSDAGPAAVQPEQAMSTTAVTAAESMSAPTPPQAMETELELDSVELTLDLSGRRGQEPLSPADDREQSTVLEFDLGEIEAFRSQQAKEEAAPAFSQGSADEDDELGSLDFSVPEDRAAPAQSSKDNGDDNDWDALQAGDFSLPSDEFDAVQASAAVADDPINLDEVGTKLDLARAYLDMGDAAGARSLLDEVVTEGNAAQQGEAQDLLRQAG